MILYVYSFEVVSSKPPSELHSSTGPIDVIKNNAELMILRLTTNIDPAPTIHEGPKFEHLKVRKPKMMVIRLFADISKNNFLYSRACIESTRICEPGQLIFSINY